MDIKSVLEDSQAIIVGDKLRHFHNKLALVWYKKRRKGLIVPVIAYNHLMRPKPSGRDFMVSKYVFTELGCGEEEIETEFFSDGLFVYGTLLPRYITPEGSIHTGWGDLDDYLWVKTTVPGFELIYNGLPYAVKSGSENVVGVTYLNSPRSIEARIDNVELGAGYTKVEAEGSVIENYPLSPTLRVRMYMHQKISGLSLPSMLYGEIFVSSSKIFWYQRKGYFDILRGNSGILITAPHGGYYRPTSINRKTEAYADENTFELASLVSEKIYELSRNRVVPNVILARIHRSFVDLNRQYSLSNPIAKEYHKEIKRIVKRYEKILLIDIHGMAKRKGRNIELGTLYGETIHRNTEVSENIRRILTRHGFRVTIDRELIGGFTVSEHSKNKNAYAIQIEVDRDLRKRKNLEKTAEALAESILSTYNQMLGIHRGPDSEDLGHRKMVSLEI